MPFPTGNFWSESPDNRPPTMAPEDAARILRAHFGMQTDPQTGDTYGDPSGALALAHKRSAEESDLAARVAREAPGASQQVESFVPGDPGRRQVTRPFADQYFTDAGALAHLQDTMAADPFTGTAEQARVGGVQKALDTAATTMRPEIGDAANTVAKRNAFADFLKAQQTKLGDLSAMGSPEAYAAAMTPIRAAGSAENQAVLDAAGGRTAEIAAKKGGGIKYTAPEQQMLDSAKTVQELGPKLMALLEQEHPGIGQDPTQYGSWTDKLGSAIGGWVYRQGKTKTARSDEIDQLVGYLGSAVPRMLVPGRVNQQQYNALKDHAPEIGFSDGANYERIHKLLTVILPDVLRGLDEAHGASPTAPALPGQEENKYAPPTDEQLGLQSPYAINR